MTKEFREKRIDEGDGWTRRELPCRKASCEKEAPRIILWEKKYSDDMFGTISRKEKGYGVEVMYQGNRFKANCMPVRDRKTLKSAKKTADKMIKALMLLESSLESKGAVRGGSGYLADGKMVLKKE